jgi:hypothetical protein
VITAGEKQWALWKAAAILSDNARSDWTARHVLGLSEAERGDWMRAAEILSQLAYEVGRRRSRARAPRKL